MVWVGFVCLFVCHNNLRKWNKNGWKAGICFGGEKGEAFVFSEQAMALHGLSQSYIIACVV